MRKVALAAHEHGAAGTILPLVSTVICVGKDGFLDHSLDRSKYSASQTPQAFQYSVLSTAYSKCTEHDFEHGTECLHLAQVYAGVRARCIEGGQNLWKVTYKPDLYAAEQIIKERTRQVAIVTGASRGIGKEVARGLRNRGMKVAMVARTEDVLVAAAKEIGCLPIVADVSKPADVEKVFKEVLFQYGRIDVVVNNAGKAIHCPISEMSVSEWQEIINGNLSSTFLCSRLAMQCMKNSGRGGVIVNVSSSSTNGGRACQGAYASSKAGIQSLTETLALEGKENGISAFCVVPRRTDTDLRRQMFPDEDPSACLRPEHVASIIVYVATEASPWLTGQSFWVR